MNLKGVGRKGGGTRVRVINFIFVFLLPTVAGEPRLYKVEEVASFACPGKREYS